MILLTSASRVAGIAGVNISAWPTLTWFEREIVYFVLKLQFAVIHTFKIILTQDTANTFPVLLPK
jgi:hypothetical protein